MSPPASHDDLAGVGRRKAIQSVRQCRPPRPQQPGHTHDLAAAQIERDRAEMAGPAEPAHLEQEIPLCRSAAILSTGRRAGECWGRLPEPRFAS